MESLSKSYIYATVSSENVYPLVVLEGVIQVVTVQNLSILQSIHRYTSKPCFLVVLLYNNRLMMVDLSHPDL